jgi:uroporphyrinogen-III synthase
MADKSDTNTVLLIKNKSRPTDLYEKILSPTYKPVFVPCLSHQIITRAISKLDKLMESGSFSPQSHVPLEELVLGRSLSHSPRYGGIIFTSQRAVEAFAMTKLKLDQNTVFYVVGPATLRALQALALPCPIRGEHCGNGEALAQFILQDYKSRDGLLFLVGEQRRDIIPKTLKGQIRVDEMEVYKTIDDPDFSANLSKAWNDVKWVVIFSPSGCQTILTLLKDHENTKIVTIGPTTRDYLINELSFTPHAVAAKPTPEGIKEAIGLA